MDDERVVSVTFSCIWCFALESEYYFRWGPPPPAGWSLSKVLSVTFFWKESSWGNSDDINRNINSHPQGHEAKCVVFLNVVTRDWPTGPGKPIYTQNVEQKAANRMGTHGGSDTRVISSSDMFVQRAIFRQTSSSSSNQFSITVPSLYSHKKDR